ncbi:hypothetical protein QOL99_10150 [Deinococcus sp. MIMF12]|uniref:LPXTG cell wall anchor domain-containing protein n=1 Tax=Deinococcus rhizophilus TaxID=3049544 RepID=A0ABT7JHV0_9DEIO|nr:hypothetical protein [Deinococcus rhizophilus]MDL2344516.1 hypothetical protein [Deinococcus rhizophilus]
MYDLSPDYSAALLMALVLLAASAVMAFGIWRRRPDLGGPLSSWSS